MLKYEPSTKNKGAAILTEHKKKEREAAKEGKRPYYLKKCSLHLLQKSATRPALFPKPSDSGVIARLRWTTRALSTTESAETAATTSPCVVFSSNDKLLSLVNSLHKEGKHELALNIFDYVDAKKVEFTPSELAFYIEILAKIKGLAAAKAYFKKVDPDFNDGDIHAKNWPAYATLLRLTSEELDELANHLHPLRISFSRIAELVSPSVVYVYGTRGEGDGYFLASGFFLLIYCLEKIDLVLRGRLGCGDCVESLGCLCVLSVEDSPKEIVQIGSSGCRDFVRHFCCGIVHHSCG
ncbi:unnamed protein product [Arabidopsis halleri]